MQATMSCSHIRCRPVRKWHAFDAITKCIAIALLSLPQSARGFLQSGGKSFLVIPKARHIGLCRGRKLDARFSALRMQRDGEWKKGRRHDLRDAGIEDHEAVGRRDAILQVVFGSAAALVSATALPAQAKMSMVLLRGLVRPDSKICVRTFADWFAFCVISTPNESTGAFSIKVTIEDKYLACLASMRKIVLFAHSI